MCYVCKKQSKRTYQFLAIYFPKYTVQRHNMCDDTKLLQLILLLQVLQFFLFQCSDNGISYNRGTICQKIQKYHIIYNSFCCNVQTKEFFCHNIRQLTSWFYCRFVQWKKRKEPVSIWYRNIIYEQAKPGLTKTNQILSQNWSWK